jgi:uncharacterized repeat protein (TIGR03803 family)
MRRKVFAIAAAVLTMGRYGQASTAKLTTLVSFSGAGQGYAPYGGLLLDAAGDLYGTTKSGAANAGTVFELGVSNYTSPTTLFAFNGSNGNSPQSTLIADAAGNLYGTTKTGGAPGDGTVFELSGSIHQTLTTLATFNGSNGMDPVASLVFDPAGNLYGTTTVGGALNGGTVFELSGVNHKTLTTLTTFNASAGSPGSSPYGGITIDAAGNLIGTTYSGGNPNNGAGAIFELSGTSHQTLTFLHNFNTSDGSSPYASLTADSNGNLYGTTLSGGPNFDGTIFELTGTNHQTFTTIYSFNGSNPSYPASPLLIDAAGNLYGTTEYGGDNGDGSVFELSANHQSLTTLVSFDYSTNGYDPSDGLVADAQGDLFGTTNAGGPNGVGTVFELTGTGFVVPEPTSLSLLAVGGIALLRRRRSL